MWQFFYSTWRSGLRGRGVQVIVAFGAVLIGVAYLASSFSLRQPKTVALDVGLSGVRFSLVLFALFWVQELMGREIERRTAVFSLTYPVTRSAYLLGRFFGVIGLLALASLLLGLLLWLAVLLAVPQYQQAVPPALGLPYWVTIFGLWVDAAVVTAFCVLIASLSTVPMLPIALGVAFAVGGKSLGAVTVYLEGGAGGLTDTVTTYGPLIHFVQWIVPDLSRLDLRAWTMYGTEPTLQSLGLGMLMAVTYATVMLALAVRVFRRRELA